MILLLRIVPFYDLLIFPNKLGIMNKRMRSVSVLMFMGQENHVRTNQPKQFARDEHLPSESLVTEGLHRWEEAGVQEHVQVTMKIQFSEMILSVQISVQGPDTLFTQTGIRCICIYILSDHLYIIFTFPSVFFHVSHLKLMLKKAVRLLFSNAQMWKLRL